MSKKRRRGKPSLPPVNTDRLQLPRDRSVTQLREAHQQRNPVPASRTAPAGDSLNSGGLHRFWPYDRATFGVGRITQSIPHCHSYKVVMEPPAGTIVCAALTHGSLIPGMGVKSDDLYPPNTDVLVLRYRGLSYGLILGAIPRRLSDGSVTLPDWVQQAGCSGLHREEVHSDVITKAVQAGGLEDFSAGRPLDSTTLAEFTRMAGTGVAVHVDEFQAYLRASEIAGLFFNYLDHHGRLAGLNFDWQTGSRIDQYRCGRGENLAHQAHIIYPWEFLGGGQPGGGQPFTTHSDEDVVYHRAVAALEPKFDDQLSFPRVQAWSGYLGQGGLREVQLPSSGSQDLNRMTKPLDRTVVLREFVGLDGAYGLSSAHSISIRKTVAIPAIKPQASPEDPKNSDGTDDNPYLGSGYKGGDGQGPDHKIGDPKPSGDHQELQALSSVMDVHAYGTQWKGVHPFHYHTKNFKVDQPGDNQQLPKAWDKLDYSAAAGADMPAPSPQTLRVDHRYNEVKYYLREVFLDMLKEGHLIAADGSGCEIRLANGSVEISAPLDIRFRAGRSIHLWAGDDCVVRANNSIDLTATKKDVRLKAEGNMQLLAGNGGNGGILLESKAQGSGLKFDGKIGEDVSSAGVIIKCQNSSLLSWTAGAYIRTGNGDASGSSDGTVATGPIILDANQGKDQIITNSQSFTRFTQIVFNDYFGSQGNIRSGISWSENGGIVPGGMQIGGQVNIVKGGGLAAEGNIATLQSYGAAGDTEVNKYSGESLQKLKAVLQETKQNLDKLKQDGQDYYKQGLNEPYYTQDKPGNSSTIQKAAFSLRDATQQYNSDQFVILESRWQQLVRTGLATGGDNWEEKSVKYQGQDLYPFPGRERFEGESLLQGDLKLVDPGSGKDKDRGELYEDVELPELKKVALKSHYLVASGT